MDRMPAFGAVRLGRSLRSRMLMLAGAAAAASLTSPALAAAKPHAKLVRCGAEDCLQVTGRRDDPLSIVRINGHAVPVEGDRNWKVRLPVEVVREWSAPHARTIEVSLGTPAGERATVTSVVLPIGMLGQTTDLASLVISAR